MVDQIPVEPPIPVLEGVDVDETKGHNGGSDDGVEISCRSPVEGDEALDQGWEVFVAGADMIGQGVAFTVMFSDKSPLVAKTKLNEARISNDDTL